MQDQFDKRIYTEIEKTLQADGNGSFKSRLHARIVEQIERVEAKLRKGSSREDYRDLTALKKGLQAAQEILDRTWSYYHP